MFRSAEQERCGLIWRDLGCYIENYNRPSGDYERWEILKALIDRGLTTSEAKALQTAIEHHRYSSIACNYYEMRLGARWDHDFLVGQRPNYHANDEIDRWRAAVALAHSDIFITDSYIADLCRRSIPQEFQFTLVFSVKQTAQIATVLERALNGESIDDLMTSTSKGEASASKK